MSYLVLARKWRPRDFESLVGQEHVVRALTHALTTQRLHHAWLFTGTRGVGKTTLSRILAKSLNCETGITPKPCGHCMACTQIDAGRFVDYVELDAASNRGVDEMTQLLEQAVYAPTSARFKVYMIDEVHMLSGHAFNAMLKTLEEPPPHVKFILATTDPQKIPATVLSRCLQFNLKQMAPESIANYLAFVLEQEQVSFEGPALRLIGQAAGGSMRDALSLTDQAIAFSAGDLSVQAVRSMLGTVDQTHLVQLLQALCQSDSAQVLEVAQRLSERGLSLRAALGDLAILLSRIAILQRVGTCELEDDALQVPVQELAQHMPADLVQLFYTVAVHSRQELALAPDEYAGFIMICLRMLGFVEPVSGSEKKSLSFTSPDSVARSTNSKSAQERVAVSTSDIDVSGADENLAVEPLPVQSTEAPPAEQLLEPATPDGRALAASLDDHAVVGHDVQAPAEGQADDHGVDNSVPPWCDEEPADSELVEREPTALPQPEVFARERIGSSQTVPDGLPEGVSVQKLDDGQMQVASENEIDPADTVSIRAPHVPSLPIEETVPPQHLATQAGLQSLQSLVQEWSRFATQLPVAGMASQLALQSVCTSVRGDTVTLRVATTALSQGAHVQRLKAALQDAFGLPVQIEVVVGELGQGESAHQIAQQEAAQRHEQAKRQLEADPFVQTLIRDLGAQIVPGSIRP